MSTKRELTAAVKKAEKTYYQLRDALDDKETKSILPKLKKKYEKKFWKYENSTGNDEKWWYYSYCKKVVNKNEVIMDCFQSSPYENEFRIESHQYFHLMQIEITKQEYIDALNDFISKCTLMRANVFNDF